MRRLLPLLLLVLAVSACGGAKHRDAAALGLDGASGRTVAAKTASFALFIHARIGGMAVQSSETGSLSFTDRRAHFYKLAPGGGIPQEIVLDGPIDYTNANIQAALKDSSVPPWTRLDTRRVPPAQLRAHPDELAHVRIAAYLANGVAKPSTVGTDIVAGEPQVHYRALVNPALVIKLAPPADRAAFRTAIANDYVTKPFLADFWLDAQGRVRRVLVGYATAGGGQIAVDGRFSDFGVKVDLTVPAASEIKDITP